MPPIMGAAMRCVTSQLMPISNDRGQDMINATPNETRRANLAQSRVRAKVEHAIRVFKHVFGFVKTSYRGSAKNAHRLFVACALANLLMARGHLFRVQGRSAS